MSLFATYDRFASHDTSMLFTTMAFTIERQYDTLALIHPQHSHHVFLTIRSCLEKDLQDQASSTNKHSTSQIDQHLHNFKESNRDHV